MRRIVIQDLMSWEVIKIMQNKAEFEKDKRKQYKGDDESGQQQKKTNSKVVKKNIEFQGKVIEIHSGDSITIQSLKSGGSVARFNFTNVRAPQIMRASMKPYAYEAKEFLRKLVIGKEVKVKMEYEKTIQVIKTEWDNEIDDYKEITEDKLLIFAQIWFEEKNLAIQLLENGFANLQRPYTEDERSILYDELKAAEDIAISKKIGVHSTSHYSFPKYNDMTISKNMKQKQWQLQHLKDGGKMHAVVELVLSGGKFKVRIIDSSIYVMFMVTGVRCLPNDENLPGYEVWSNKALKFSKENLMQRDVIITVSSMDRKGNFHGSLSIKNLDFGELLLSEGLALVFGDKNARYEEVEKEAREKNVGLWKANLKLDVIMGGLNEKNINYCNKTFNATISEVIDMEEIYIQEPINQTLNDIEKVMGNFDPEKYLTLQAPIKKGTPCVALFSQDGQYYRSTVVKQIPNKKDTYLVHFSDYGNYDEVNFNEIRKMPEKLSKIPPQAMKCNLAYVVGPVKKSPVHQDAIEKFMDLAFEKKIVVQLVYTLADINFVIINTPDQLGPEKSVNALLLKKGLVKLDQGLPLPENLQIFTEIQEQAYEKKYGAWKYEDDD